MGMMSPLSHETFTTSSIHTVFEGEKGSEETEGGRERERDLVVM